VLGSSRPAFCDEPWCYVNATECRKRETGRRYRETDYLIGGEGLAYYSYETCGGSTEAWTTSLIERSIKGKILTVGVPKSFYPEQFAVDGNGEALPDGPYTAGSQLSGVWVEYLEAMASLGEFTVTYVPVSNASRSDHSSLWTACVADVADGIVDMCVGNFWVMPDRIGLGVHFITPGGGPNPTSIDNFRLLSPRIRNEVKFSERLWSPFAPFSVGLWFSIGCTFFIVAALYSFLGSSNDFANKTLADSIKTDVEGEVDLNKTERQLNLPWVKSIPLRRYFRQFYFATMEFFNAGVSYEGADNFQRKLSVRIVKFGYALFVIVSISCFVGNMAAMRAVAPDTAEITSVEQCASSTSCKLCLHSVTQSYFVAQYPTLNYYVSSSSKNLIVDLLDGKCTVSMSQGLHFGALGDSVNVNSVCDYKYSDNSLYNMYVSMPAADQYSQALSSLSVDVMNTGKYQELYNKYFTSYNSICAVEVQAEGEVEELDESFAFTDFLGLYFIVGTLFILGVIVDYADHQRLRFKYVERTRSTLSLSASKRNLDIKMNNEDDSDEEDDFPKPADTHGLHTRTHSLVSKNHEELSTTIVEKHEELLQKVDELLKRSDSLAKKKSFF